MTESPINSTNTNLRKTKPNGIDHCQQTKSCQNMKSVVSPKQTLIPTIKRITPDYSDMERNNIYADTPPKTKPTPSSVSPPTLVNGTNHYLPMIQQKRQPNIPTRNNITRSMHEASSSSMSSFSTAASSSQSTTPSNSFRHDATSMMTRSADASSSSSCGLITQTKHGTNNTKSKSTYDIDLSVVDRSRQQTKENLNNNSKCLNTITNGNFVPLQSVKEDECLEVDHDRNKKHSKV